MEEKRPEKIKSIDEVKGGIESKLKKKKEKKEVKERIECLKEKYQVIMNTELLSSEKSS